jgi:hypothetical protein
MRSLLLKSSLAIAVAMSLSIAPAAERAVTAPTNGVGPVFKSVGPLTFSGDGTLFAADTQAASIFALDLGTLSQGGAPGAKAIAGIDGQIAALLGTDVKEISVTDLAVHPKTRNAYLSVMRGQGANARAVLLRVDGAGKIELIAFDKVKYSKVDLPNAPVANEANPAIHEPPPLPIWPSSTGGCMSRGSRTKSSPRSCGRSPTRSRLSTAAPASRSITAITGSSKRARPSTRSCRTRSTVRRISLPAICARRW